MMGGGAMGAPDRGDNTKVEVKESAEKDPMLSTLKRKILAEKTVTETVTGLLFFPLDKEKTETPGPCLHDRNRQTQDAIPLTRIEDLDTPALLVDLDIMERNLQRVADYAALHNLRLRPHTKTHKSLLIAQRQLALGAAGLTVAKTGEAEVMLGAGPARSAGGLSGSRRSESAAACFDRRDTGQERQRHHRDRQPVRRAAIFAGSGSGGGAASEFWWRSTWGWAGQA